jgi:CpeT protein
MKDLFCKYFEGYFDNQNQAFTRPHDFALILVNHKYIDVDTFKVTQEYSYEDKPYRSNIVRVFEQDQKILLKNYKEDGLTYLDGCDTIFEFDGVEFHGKNVCNECYIHKDGKDTYLMTEILLGNGYYRVIDKGFDVETHQHVWGSFNGFFEFDRK